MSGKVRMRCARCGKHFKSVSAKHTLCPDCEARERAARAAGKGTSSLRPPVTPVTAQRPTIVGPGAAILVPELAQKSPLPTTGSALGHMEKASYGEPRPKVASASRNGERASTTSDPERADHSGTANRTPKPIKQKRPCRAAPEAPKPADSFVCIK